MLLLQLNPPLPVITPKGKGMAIILHDYGLEHNNLWTVIQDTNEIWTWTNQDVRAQSNITLGRPLNTNQNAKKPEVLVSE